MSADTNTRTPWTPWLVRGGVSRMEHTHSQPALQFACGSARAPDGPTTNSAETVAIVAQGRFEHITERCCRGNCMACRLFIAVVARGKSLVYKIEPWRAVRPVPGPEGLVACVCAHWHKDVCFAAFVDGNSTTI